MPHETDPGHSVAEAASVPPAVDEIPEWFQQFLDHRQASKPSVHTMKDYRRDFIAIAKLLADGEPIQLGPADITRDSMRTAFAAFAADHEAASIRRCWSTWNVLCTFLYTNELLAAYQRTIGGQPHAARWATEVEEAVAEGAPPNRGGSTALCCHAGIRRSPNRLERE